MDHFCNHCLAAIQLQLCLISHLNVSSLCKSAMPRFSCRYLVLWKQTCYLQQLYLQHSYLDPFTFIANEMEEGTLYHSSAPVVKSVPVMCQVPKLSLLCELPQSLLSRDYNKMHVGQAACAHHLQWSQQYYGEIYTGCGSDRDNGSVFYLKKCHLSHCYIHNYEEKHLIPLALTGIRQLAIERSNLNSLQLPSPLICQGCGHVV